MVVASCVRFTVTRIESRISFRIAVQCTSHMLASFAQEAFRHLAPQVRLSCPEPPYQ